MGLELKLEGRILNESGRLLIGDPCYLEGFDFSNVDEIEMILFDRFSNLQEERLKIMTKESKHYKQVSDLLDRYEDNPSMLAQELKKIKRPNNGEERKVLDEKIKDLSKEPSFNAPYFLQGYSNVLIHTPYGDGVYPVVFGGEKIEIVYNYPLKTDKQGIEVLDKQRLWRRLLGYSCVDSGTQIILDASSMRIRNDVSKNSFCVVELPKGEYVCKFGKGNEKVELRRV